MTKYSEWEMEVMKLVIAHVDLVELCRNRDSCVGCPIMDGCTDKLCCDAISPLELIEYRNESKTESVLKTAARAFRDILK